MVVREDRAVEIETAAGGSEIAGSGVDRIGRVPRIGHAVTARVRPPAEPGRRHELHPADRTCRARTHVAAEIRLDLVDRREYLPRDAVRRAGLLPDAEQLRITELLEGDRRRRERQRQDQRAGAVGRREARQCDGGLRWNDAERRWNKGECVSARRAADARQQREHRREWREPAHR
jgi:hypothetical protein